MGISKRFVFSVPFTAGLLVTVFSAAQSGKLAAEEVVEDGLEFSVLSVGTLVQNNVNRGEARGKLVYFDAQPADDGSFLDNWINGDLQLPDGSTRNIAERIREDNARSVWNLELISELPHEAGEMDTTKVPKAGTYGFDAEAMVEGEEFRIQGEASFELSEAEAENFLPIIRDDDVHVELTDDGLALEWPDLDGAQSYHVSIRLDNPRMQTQFVTGDNHYLYAEAESAEIQTLIIRAFSAPPNPDYDGERTTRAFHAEPGEAVHGSLFQK